MRKQKQKKSPKEQDEIEEQSREAKDERDNPIEEAASGVTNNPSDPVPTGEPDPRRPPYGDPRGGKRPRKRQGRKVA